MREPAPPFLRTLPLVAAILGAGLTSCAAPRTPEPKVVTQTVNMPTPVPCDPKLGPEPVYPDTPDSVRAVPPGQMLELVKLLLAGRELRIAWINEQAAAIQGCAKLPGAK